MVYFILSVALPAVAVVTLVYIRPDLLLAGYEGRDFTVGQRLLTEARVVVDYIVWTIVPNIRTLALYHDDIPLSTGLWNPPTTLTSILVIVALIGSAFAVRRRWPLASLGILWFFAGQALESTAYPLELVFEHRNYLPDYGILLAIIGHPLLHVRSRRSAWVSGALLAAFVGLLTSMTGMRSYEWRNNVTQAVYAAAHHPKSPRAMYAVGRIYANLVLTGGSNDSKRAYDALEDASRLDPAGIMPDVSLIIFSARRHVSPRATWFTRIMTRLATKPFTAADIASLKQLVQCAQKYCVTMAEPIKRILDTAVVSAKQRGANPRRTADLLTIQAQFLSNRLGDFEGARKNMEEAARLAPNRAQYHINLAKLYLVLGDRAKAASEIRTLETMNSLDQLSPMISTLKRSLRRSNNSRGPDTAQPRATSPNHGILSVKPAHGD
ncbi:MAG: tetratricopeptide repeat protein [Gammaproteobacteria bacterium]